MIYIICKGQEITTIDTSRVRWLECRADYPLAKDYWKALGQELTRDTWTKAHEYGYQYAAIIEDGRIASMAGVWRFSEDCWEAAAVSTLEGFRRRGYAKSCVAFVIEYILAAGKLATCSTGDDNLAMIATAKSVGFQVLPKERVWWNYPNLPEF